MSRIEKSFALVPLTEALVGLVSLACGGGNDKDKCSEVRGGAEGNCSKQGYSPHFPIDDPENNPFRRWGAWEKDGKVNAWNDCGNGGSSPGTPGTLDCPDPANTDKAESTWGGIQCTDGGGNVKTLSC